VGVIHVELLQSHVQDRLLGQRCAVCSLPRTGCPNLMRQFLVEFICYENLKKKARKNIWKSFLKQAETQNGAVIIGPKHLESLTEAELNGRQVCQLFHISPQGLPLTASRSRMPWRRRMLWRLSRELRWLILISSRLSRQAKTSSASFMAFMPSTAYISDGICVRIRSN
jgi:hypothetical protein